MPPQHTFYRRLRVLACAAAFLPLASGCINSLRPRGSYSAYPSTSGATAGFGATSGVGTSAAAAAGFTCPQAANVYPVQNEFNDGSGTYTACPSSKSQSDLLIFGRTFSLANSVCVFPVSYAPQNGKIYLKPNLATGLPIYQCASIGSMGASMSFPATQYNAVIVVEGNGLNDMISCYIANQSLACPAYSYGKFR